MQALNTPGKLADVLFMCLKLLQSFRSIFLYISNVTLVVFQPMVHFLEFRLQVSMHFVRFTNVSFVVFQVIVNF